MTVKVQGSSPETNRAPLKAIPEMALAPDMSGVCSVGGTLLITSKPTKEANTNTNRLLSSVAVVMNSQNSFR
jgi:hypothetical protein